jgi:RHS repeat-associated protein
VRTWTGIEKESSEHDLDDGSAYARCTYTGREVDADTGLYYFNARWYEPGSGKAWKDLQSE